MSSLAADRYWQAKKATLIGALVNALLGIIKVLGGAFFHSHALIADGVHSFSDLVTDAMVLFASKYSSQDADISHPYGHKRFETAATLLLSLLLILAGLGIAWDAIYELHQHSFSRPGSLALPIAIFSIVANELLFHYTQQVGKKIQSTLILANAWHHRSDAASSIVVALGLLGSLAGFTYLDTIAAIIVGGMIVKMGINYAWNSVKELVDTAVEPKTLAKIMQIIAGIGGVEKIHQLRSRLMGGDIFIDVHILVSPKLSVSEGHFIAQQVHYALIHHFDRVRDVTVHVDPEDDETQCPSLHLMPRSTLEKGLLLPWQEAYPEIKSWVLHYLEGHLYIDLLIKGGDGKEKEHGEKLMQIEERLRKDINHFPEIAEVKLIQGVHIIDNT
jgi:cation diffusion facilitator family transporter